MTDLEQSGGLSPIALGLLKRPRDQVLFQHFLGILKGQVFKEALDLIMTAGLPQ